MATFNLFIARNNSTWFRKRNYRNTLSITCLVISDQDKVVDLLISFEPLQKESQSNPQHTQWDADEKRLPDDLLTAAAASAAALVRSIPNRLDNKDRQVA